MNSNLFFPSFSRLFIIVLLLFSSFKTYSSDSLIVFTSADSYVRGGTYANDNYGTEDKAKLKQENNPSFTRVIYLKFDLRGFEGTIDNAVLKLNFVSAGPTWNGNIIKLYKVSNNWTETGLNFNNAPAFSGSSIDAISVSGFNSINIKSFVTAALAQDSILSVAITKEEGEADDWADIATKENSNISLRPNLTIGGTLPKAQLISPSDNQIDWSEAGVQGEIPLYTNIIYVEDIGLIADGTSDNSPALQSAINNASQGTVFKFGSGIYLFNTSIKMKDGIIIRGNCVEETELKFDLGGTAAPSFDFDKNNTPNFKTVSAGFQKGSKVITVSDGSSFIVGDYIEILQDNDPVKMFTQPTWDVSWAANSVGQLVEIIGVNGNQISLKNELYYTFSTALNVRAQNVSLLKNSGLEGFKITRVDDGNDYNLVFDYTVNCWIRNIEGNYSDRGHVAINRSAHIEIRDSYFHHAHNYGGGGHGYGVNLQDHATDCLIENNIFYFLRHAFLAKEGSIGNVFAYNYSHTPNGSNNDIALHGHYGLYNLLEGNVVQKIIAGDYWGPSGPGNTYFRNRVETSDIEMADYTHEQNIIANEIVKGTVKISADTKDTWQHNNFNASGIIDIAYNTTIPSSLYLTSKPSFFNNMNWPAIGPEFSVSSNIIPAKKRWDDNTLVTCVDYDVVTNTSNLINHQIIVFPNPFSDYLIIDFGSQLSQVKIIDVTGKMIFTHQAVGQVSVSTTHLASGIYFIVDENNQTKKLIKN